MKKAAGRAAQGAGSIRKRAAGGWEARYTVGRDPGTGKQIQESVYGKTQAETRKKLAAAVAALDSGTYFEPSKATLGNWLDTWLEEYATPALKPLTVDLYARQCANHIKPVLGALRLAEVNATAIQRFYNQLLKGGLSSKTIKNIHGVLHRALNKAAELRYIPFNSADACTLPRIQKP